MGEKIDSRSAVLTRWLMIYSRPLIFALLAINLIVAGGLSLVVSPENSQQVAVTQMHSAQTPVENDLLLLSEVRLEELVTAEPQEGEAQDALIKECRVWGPQVEVVAFSELSQKLEITGGFPEVVEVQIAAPPSFMVFVDVREGSTQTRQVMQELTAVEIDNYRIARDEGDIVSVGVFSNRDLAEKQLQKVRELGYATNLETIERSQTVYTLHGYVENDSELFASSSHECGKEVGLEVSQY